MMGGLPAERLAVFDVNTGSRLTEWQGWAGGDVLTLAVGGSSLYVGGDYTVLNGAPRPGLGALDATSGTLLPWLPPASNSTVNSVSLDAPVVISGGNASLTAIHGTTGGPFSWGPFPGDFRSVALHGSDVYGGGNLTLESGGTFNLNLARFPNAPFAGVDPEDSHAVSSARTGVPLRVAKRLCPARQAGRGVEAAARSARGRPARTGSPTLRRRSRGSDQGCRSWRRQPGRRRSPRGRRRGAGPVWPCPRPRPARRRSAAS